MRIFKRLIVVALLICVCTASVSFAQVAVPGNMHPDKAYKAGKILFDQAKWDKALPYFVVAAKGNPTASNLRITADTLAQLRRYDEAVVYYKNAALKYDKIDKNAAIALRNKANAITSEVQLYSVVEKTIPAAPNLGKFEPQNGMYFGAFVEYEPKIQGQPKALFNQLSGVNHPVFFTYHHYGAPFPHRWAQDAKNAGAAIHLALEATKGLSSIKDDQYLKDFALACAAAQMPIFIRLNSEMNGDWVSWHDNPQQYIETFRIVANAMKKDAPNVAMVWAPNAVPIHNIATYYPGDAYVDWVGVNLYSVSVFNGDAKQPSTQVNPLDLLDAVYKTYADKKPIQVAEYAATHYSAAEKKDQTAFALAKMRLLYHGVKYKYPRVKSINWYSANNLVKAHSPERRLNNYSLLDNVKLLTAYANLLKEPYYLKQVVNGPSAPAQDLSLRPTYTPLSTGAKISQTLKIESYIKSYDPFISKVVYKLNDQVIATTTAMPYAFELPIDKAKAGKNTLDVIVFDSQGRVATKRSLTIIR